MTCLCLVQRSNQTVEIRRLDVIRTEVINIVSNALFATGNGKQLAVKFHIPVPVEAKCLKCLVKSGTMAITFGVSERSINVE